MSGNSGACREKFAVCLGNCGITEISEEESTGCEAESPVSEGDAMSDMAVSTAGEYQLDGSVDDNMPLSLEEDESGSEAVSQLSKLKRNAMHDEEYQEGSTDGSMPSLEDPGDSYAPQTTNQSDKGRALLRESALTLVQTRSQVRS